MTENADGGCLCGATRYRFPPRVEIWIGEKIGWKSRDGEKAPPPEFRTTALGWLGKS